MTGGKRCHPNSVLSSGRFGVGIETPVNRYRYKVRGLQDLLHPVVAVSCSGWPLPPLSGPQSLSTVAFSFYRCDALGADLRLPKSPLCKHYVSILTCIIIHQPCGRAAPTFFVFLGGSRQQNDGGQKWTAWRSPTKSSTLETTSPPVEPAATQPIRNTSSRHGLFPALRILKISQPLWLEFVSPFLHSGHSFLQNPQDRLWTPNVVSNHLDFYLATLYFLR